MWPCYGVHVHITVCMALLVCVLCQPVHAQPALHGLDFFLEIFLWRLQTSCYATSHACASDLSASYLFLLHLYYDIVRIVFNMIESESEEHIAHCTSSCRRQDTMIEV